MGRPDRRPFLALIGLLLVAACAKEPDRIQSLDTSGLDQIMLNYGDPTEAVKYFSAEAAREPGSSDAKLDLALALSRAGRYEEAIGFFEQAIGSDGTTPQHRISYANALIRNGDWEGAQAQVNLLPDSFKGYDRSRLEAVLADIRQEWTAADRHYRAARSQTVEPASVLNNWGVSYMTRGNMAAAEEKFREAISFDPTLFAAKNNLVIARGRQGNYQLPIIPMTDKERAELLHDLAVVALDSGDDAVARTLLEESVKSHPQHYAPATEKLAAL